jgi:phosphoserine phosphatase RsbU/P
MPAAIETDFRQELLNRRGQLDRAQEIAPAIDLTALLGEVDAALARIARGTYGRCEVCHEDIGAVQLGRDPLARSCEEHPAPFEGERLRRDLEAARHVQLELLPARGLRVAGWQYQYQYEAAGDVGGDFCDVIQRPERDETVVLVGDVSGKGIAASLFMSSLLATFRSLAKLDLEPADLLARASDQFMSATRGAAYATIAAAVLRPRGAADLYSAGHWPPLVTRNRSTTPATVVPGLPVGLFGGTQYAPTRVQLESGDLLTFFTDGVIDAENRAGDDYSRNRLVRIVNGSASQSLDHILERSMDDVRSFRNGEPQTDDMLMFALRAEY